MTSAAEPSPAVGGVDPLVATTDTLHAFHPQFFRAAGAEFCERSIQQLAASTSSSAAATRGPQHYSSRAAAAAVFAPPRERSRTPSPSPTRASSSRPRPPSCAPCASSLHGAQAHAELHPSVVEEMTRDVLLRRARVTATSSSATPLTSPVPSPTRQRTTVFASSSPTRAAFRPLDVPAAHAPIAAAPPPAPPTAVNVAKLVALATSTWPATPAPSQYPADLPARPATADGRRALLASARPRTPPPPDDTHRAFLSAVTACITPAVPVPSPAIEVAGISRDRGDRVRKAAQATAKRAAKDQARKGKGKTSEAEDVLVGSLVDVPAIDDVVISIPTPAAVTVRGGGGRRDSTPSSPQSPTSPRFPPAAARVRGAAPTARPAPSPPRVAAAPKESRSSKPRPLGSRGVPLLRLTRRGSVGPRSPGGGGGGTAHESMTSTNSSNYSLESLSSVSSVSAPIRGTTANAALGLISPGELTLSESDRAKLVEFYRQNRPDVAGFSTYDHTKVVRVLHKRPHQRTKREVKVAYKYLHRLKEFERISMFVMMDLISCMHVDEFDEGMFVFKQGDIGTCWYVILSGGCQICVSPTGNVSDMRPVRVLSAGCGFGELALMSDKPRGATIKTLTKTILARVEKDTYARIMRLQHTQDLTLKTKFLQKIVPFDTWPEPSARAVAEVIEWTNYRPGEVIVREGHPTTCIHFVSQGVVDCYRTCTLADGTLSQVKVATLGPAEYFNESLVQTGRAVGSAAGSRGAAGEPAETVWASPVTAIARGAVTLGNVAVLDARAKLAVALVVKPMYDQSPAELARMAAAQAEKARWVKVRRQNLDALAKEVLHDPAASWRALVARRARGAEGALDGDGAKRKKAAARVRAT
ncbi:cAMP-dependent protein kinase type I regulatory subunit [Allomyces arbusculus]|nr:cAMP-dependent protein kinase type I regulatory subunit [Allomyces arbusculus]